MLRKQQEPFDAVIIGGSFAGLSAAMALGRAGRTVLVVDSGKPCNHKVTEVHNLITHDGEHPGRLLTKARAELEHYSTIRQEQGTVTDITGTDGAFEVVAGDHRWRARKILLATGVKDEPLPLPGFADCWGRSVLHCPFCHGYEVKDEVLGVLGNGAVGYELARLIRNWRSQLTLFSNGPSELTSEQLKELMDHGVGVDERRIRRFMHTNGQLHQIAFSDGEPAPVHALFARIPFTLPEALIQASGCALSETGHVQVNEMKQTSVPGIYAAGDLTTPMRSLPMAIAAGNMAGAAITHGFISTWS